MTKTIEFVERKIEDKKYKLKKLENLKNISNKYELEINESLMESVEEDIEYLEQIKCELEAWEVVKRELVLTVKEDKHKYDFVYYWLIYHPYELLEIEKKDYEILKKVLEVEIE